MVFMIHKPLGWTPLQALEQLRQDRPELASEVLSYAGRLDPMAEGLLLVLTGPDTKRQAEYNGLDKAYEAEILVGISTDTHDVLGMPRVSKSRASGTSASGRAAGPDETSVRKALKTFEGDYAFRVPAYSSWKVRGKPLFWWAHHGRLDEIEIPVRTTAVYAIEPLASRSLTAQALLAEVTGKLATAPAKLRRNEAREAWEKLLARTDSPQHEKKPGNAGLLLVSFRISCSSGTYVRALARDAGKLLHTDACLFSLKRTAIDTAERNGKISPILKENNTHDIDKISIS